MHSATDGVIINPHGVFITFDGARTSAHDLPEELKQALREAVGVVQFIDATVAAVAEQEAASIHPDLRKHVGVSFIVTPENVSVESFMRLWQHGQGRFVIPAANGVETVIARFGDKIYLAQGNVHNGYSYREVDADMQEGFGDAGGRKRLVSVFIADLLRSTSERLSSAEVLARLKRARSLA